LLCRRRNHTPAAFNPRIPHPLEKSACNYDYIASIWREFSYYFQENDFYIGVQTKRGCPHNCCYCIYTVVEGKQVRINPADEVVKEMRQLYDRGIRNFWFTDAQFIPTRKFINDVEELLEKILAMLDERYPIGLPVFVPIISLRNCAI
jgi:radical SAM superfamily enzyme YgiQ (UPF0313 family)